jgi:hypothetical protein
MELDPEKAISGQCEINASAFSNSDEKEHAMKSTDSTLVAVLLMLKRQDDMCRRGRYLPRGQRVPRGQRGTETTGK